jgi:glycosyltransferase involved in cell wall biosynthesis
MGKKQKHRKNGAGQKSKQGSSKPAPISLCMIVKNEERYLEDCLASVANLVSEMIIVDTGSTDRTIEIARRYDAKIFEIPWEGDFAKARNYSLEKATQPWILYLDADERLYPPYHPLIKEAIRLKDFDAYYIRVASQVNGVLGNMPHVQSYPRLFRRKPEYRFIGRIHEQITPSIEHHGGKFAQLNVEIEHLGYNLSEAELQAKIQRNLEALQQHVKEMPDYAYAHFQLGQTLILAQKVSEGKKHLEKALALNQLNVKLKANTLLLLANLDFDEKNYHNAIEKIQQVFKIAPAQRVGYFLISECYAKTNQLKEALEALSQYWRYADKAFTDLGLDKIIPPYIIYQREAIYHYELKNYAASFERFKRYFDCAPTFRIDSLQRMIVAATHSHQTDSLPAILKPLLEKLEKFNQPQETVELILHWCSEGIIVLPFELVIDKAIQKFPSNGIYHFYRGNYLLSVSDYKAADRAFREALGNGYDTFDVRNNLAISLIKQLNFAAAIEEYQTIAEKYTEQKELALRRIAGLQMKLGETEKASYYARAASLIRQGI